MYRLVTLVTGPVGGISTADQVAAFLSEKGFQVEVIDSSGPNWGVGVALDVESLDDALYVGDAFVTESFLTELGGVARNRVFAVIGAVTTTAAEES